MTASESYELELLGYTIKRNVVPPDWLGKLSVAIDQSFVDHREIQIKNNNDIKTKGVALHALLNDSIFIEFLKYQNFLNYFKNYNFKFEYSINYHSYTLMLKKF